MSLLTQISNIFSKKQSERLVGISLQQESIVICSLPSINEITSAENDETQNVNFQQLNVKQLDYSSAIIESQVDGGLVGKCHIVINAQQSQIVQVDKPNVPAAEINGALKWQIKDLVTISPENMVLDYFDGPMLAGGKEKINVVCSPINDLKKIVAAANENDMEVVSITIPEFAFANLLPVQNDACLLVCQQPNEEIVLLIVKQGKLYFHRRLRGFSQIASKTEDELTMTVIDSLALEIQRSSDFFERQLKQAPLKDIKVLLPISLESFFARKLAENSHVPVSLLALPEAYKTHREYAAAIGSTMIDASISVVEPPQELIHAN
jgi:MSHA biogenesis protein MshI